MHTDIESATTWLRQREILNRYPVGWRKLKGWVKKGWVRSAKLGDNQQSPRLYSVEDLKYVLEAIADGRRPTSALTRQRSRKR